MLSVLCGPTEASGRLPVPETALTPTPASVRVPVSGLVLRSTGRLTWKFVTVFGCGWATLVSATKKQQRVCRLRPTTKRIGAGFGPERTEMRVIVPLPGTVPTRGSTPGSITPQTPDRNQVQSGVPEA